MTTKRIFLSHSGYDKSIAEALFNFFVGLNVARDEIFCSSVEGRGVQSGRNWKDSIKSSIEDCEIFFALHTTNFMKSEFCQKELGIAWALKKPLTFLDMKKNENEPNDSILFDVQGHFCTEESLTTLCIDLKSRLNLPNIDANAIKQICQAFLAHVEHAIEDDDRDVLIRGELFDDIIDAALLMKQDENANLIQAIEKSLKTRTLPAKYQYATATGADNWLKLCDDREYITYRSSLNFLEKSADEILARIDDEAILSSPDFISLGPGDGAKDEILLRKMIEYRKNVLKHDDNIDWYYYPYDISIDLLRKSIARVANKESIRENLKIKAISADFDALAGFKPVFDYRPEVNFFALLGNTLGNMTDEAIFLKRVVQSTMNIEDYLLIEVRLATDEGLKPGGSEEKRKRFNFSPLEFLGVEYKEERIKYERMSAGISQIGGTTSLVGKTGRFTYKRKTYNDVELCRINFYEMDKLHRSLEEIGFEICWEGQSDDKSVGIFLLKQKLDS